MVDFDLLTGLYLLGAAILGGIIGFFVSSRQSNKSLDKVGEDWQIRFDKAVGQNEKLNAEVSTLRNSVEAAKTIVQKHVVAAAQSRTAIESLREKEQALKKNLFQISTERDELKGRMASHQNVVSNDKQRIAALQAELDKGLGFYKAQLEAGVEERKLLQRKVDDAKSEQQSLSNLLTAARTEYDSVSKLLTTAQSRLENLEALEGKVISLEADNAQLKHEITLANKGAETLRREVADMNALKKQNAELAQCLKSMEASRKQYEADALRYRSQIEKSEKESDTLRFKIGDIQKSWEVMHQAQQEIQGSGNGKAKAPTKAPASAPAKAPTLFGLKEPDGEKDDLTQIIGIGKVFERTLHDLGIFHFRQIASFGPAEIARINSELKEFKGRIEHDDWIGQAKELHFKKYGEQ
jgi:predicted flap endonuclease-1-like 5' DNA nuclease/predicted  nucleic acid-binding Zn-ribbon protein